MFSFLSLFTYFFHVILGIGTPQNFPAPLSAEEEQAAFERMANSQGQDAEDARQTLILHNLRLVFFFVEAIAIIIASAAAVAPSYIEAFVQSMPVSSVIID